jgi:hypothetical protein
MILAGGLQFTTGQGGTPISSGSSGDAVDANIVTEELPQVTARQSV